MLKLNHARKRGHWGNYNFNLLWTDMIPTFCVCLTTLQEHWRHLHCSQITACVFYGLIPSFCSFISRFWSGSYLRFELPVNRYRRKCLPIPNVTGFFCPNCSGSSVSKTINSHHKVRQPCLYFKDSKGVFEHYAKIKIIFTHNNGIHSK